MNFKVQVWTGTESYSHDYNGRYETRDSGVLLVIDEENRTKVTYGPAGWFWVEEQPDDEQ